MGRSNNMLMECRIGLCLYLCDGKREWYDPRISVTDQNGIYAMDRRTPAYGAPQLHEEPCEQSINL